MSESKPLERKGSGNEWEVSAIRELIPRNRYEITLTVHSCKNWLPSMRFWIRIKNSPKNLNKRDSTNRMLILSRN